MIDCFLAQIYGVADSKPAPLSMGRLNKCLLHVYLRLSVRWPSGRRRRFAKAAGDYRTGLKLMISGPFFIGMLVVGVGSRMTVLGPRLGTLAGTLEPMPMYASLSSP